MIVFLLSTWLSFIGSLPPGNVNMMYMQAIMEKKVTKANCMLVGVALAELVGSSIAWYFNGFIASSPVITSIVQYIFLAALVSMLVLLIYKQYHAKPTIGANESNIKSMSRAFLWVAFNPQLILFWTAVLFYLKSKNIIDRFNSINLLLVASGAIVGSLLAYWAYAFLGNILWSSWKAFLLQKYHWILMTVFTILILLEIHILFK